MGRVYSWYSMTSTSKKVLLYFCRTEKMGSCDSCVWELLAPSNKQISSYMVSCWISLLDCYCKPNKQNKYQSKNEIKNKIHFNFLVDCRCRWIQRKLLTVVVIDIKSPLSFDMWSSHYTTKSLTLLLIKNSTWCCSIMDRFTITTSTRIFKIRGATQFNQPLPDWCNGTVHGTTWTRKKFNKKFRTLLNI